jgi:lipoyl(octanoyl) transferase
VGAVTSASCRADSSRPVATRWLGLIDYQPAWDEQRAIATARADGTGGDELLLLEHRSVYTAGRRTREWEKPTDGTPVIDVDRGGKITWHGPGQLVGYPIIKLSDPVDVVDYVRRLEEALIEVCAQFGVAGGRIDGRSGVWLAADGHRQERKIAAIGCRVQRGVTLHGFSLNCDADLSAFSRIVPCGITDAGVTSLSVELGRNVDVAEALPVATECVRAALDGSLTVQDHPVARPQEPSAPGLTLDLHPALR